MGLKMKSLYTVLECLKYNKRDFSIFWILNLLANKVSLFDLHTHAQYLKLLYLFF